MQNLLESRRCGSRREERETIEKGGRGRSLARMRDPKSRGLNRDLTMDSTRKMTWITIPLS